LIFLPPADSDFPGAGDLYRSHGKDQFCPSMIDRKGITDSVILNGMTLMNWEVRGFPMSDGYVESLEATGAGT
jgi:beta-galactosidase